MVDAIAAQTADWLQRGGSPKVVDHLGFAPS